MRRLLALLVAFLTSLSQGALAIGTLEQLQLRGPVKRCFFRFSTIGQPDTHGWSACRDFDEQGRMTYYCTFNPDGSVEAETRWRYILDGDRLVGIVRTGEDPSESFVRYDDAGRVVVTETRTPENRRMLIYLDAEGHQVGTESVSPDGSVQTRSVTTHSSDGKPAKTDEFDASGRSVSTTESTSTPEGRPLTRKTSPIPGSQIVGSFVLVTHEYDERGLMVSRSMIESEGVLPVSRWRYEYDDFDDYGNYTTVTTYERNEWQREISDFQLTDTEKRRITYYD